MQTTRALHVEFAAFSSRAKHVFQHKSYGRSERQSPLPAPMERTPFRQLGLPFDLAARFGDKSAEITVAHIQFLTDAALHAVRGPVIVVCYETGHANL